LERFAAEISLEREISVSVFDAASAARLAVAASTVRIRIVPKDFMMAHP